MTPHDAPTHEAPTLPHLQELVAHLSQDAGHPNISRRRALSEPPVRSQSKAIFERLGVNEHVIAIAIGSGPGLIS